MNDGLTRKETPVVVEIQDARHEPVRVKLGDGGVYDIFYDKYTGDWLLVGEDDDRIQDFWFLSKGGAMQYLLKYLGLIEAAEYSFAPDRC